MCLKVDCCTKPPVGKSLSFLEMRKESLKKHNFDRPRNGFKIAREGYLFGNRPRSSRKEKRAGRETISRNLATAFTSKGKKRVERGILELLGTAPSLSERQSTSLFKIEDRVLARPSSERGTPPGAGVEKVGFVKRQSDIRQRDLKKAGDNYRSGGKPAQGPVERKGHGIKEKTIPPTGKLIRGIRENLLAWRWPGGTGKKRWIRPKKRPIFYRPFSTKTLNRAGNVSSTGLCSASRALEEQNSIMSKKDRGSKKGDMLRGPAGTEDDTMKRKCGVKVPKRAQAPNTQPPSQKDMGAQGLARTRGGDKASNGSKQTYRG